MNEFRPRKLKSNFLNLNFPTHFSVFFYNLAFQKKMLQYLYEILSMQHEKEVLFPVYRCLFVI